MSEAVEITENVRVYVDKVDRVPDDAHLEIADKDDPADYYYEVPITELGNVLGKRYIRYDGPEGRGFFDTVRGELRTRSRGRDGTSGEEVKEKIFDKAERLLNKYKIYISEADTFEEAQQMAPEWADVQTTEQGAFYYEKLPGQGEGGDGDDQDLQVGDYDVDTQFGKIVADRVNRDDVGDIPVDDFHEYMDQIDDPELVKDALQAEIDGPGRKTGKQFIERRARALDIDLDLFYKDSGPDETGSSVTSLVDMEVDVEELSSEIVVPAGDENRTTQDWSVQKLYEVYVQGDKGMPTGMGNPDDIPGGKLTSVLEEEVEDPAVLMDFWEEGNYQVKRDVGDHLEEEYGYIPKVETVSSEWRFDLDGMQKYMTDEEIADLEEGDVAVFDDMAGGLWEVDIESIDDDGFALIDGPGRGGTMEVHAEAFVKPEYYVATVLEHDAPDIDAGMLDFTFEDGIIEAIEDESVLSRAVKWEEEDNGMDLRPETVDRMEEHLTRLSPPDPEEYDMTEESMSLLHGANWPEWDYGAKRQGTGVSDDLNRVYNNATTEDLRNYLDVCEDTGLDERADVVRGMLYYREDADTGVWDIFDYERTAHGNYAGATEDTEERIEVGVEMTMDNLEPHVGAQLAGHIEKFELQQPPEGSSWAGQSQSGGRVMAIDDPYNVERTTSHEMGHAFHNFMGIKNDGYGTIDNREASGPQDWEFGAKPPSNSNEKAQEFYESVKEEWEKYRKSKQGELEGDDAVREIRSYQKRHGVEMMAVGFAHWNMDPYKVRNRHPGLAKVFDQHLSDGIVDPIPGDEVEEGNFYEVARQGIGRVTAEVKKVEESEAGVTSFHCRIVDGPQQGRTMWFSTEDSIFEAKSEEYSPMDMSHGMKYTVESGGEEKEVYIDRKSRSPGGDFIVRDETGRSIGQWMESQLRDKAVDTTGEEGEIPWSPDQAKKGDVVEMHGVEVTVSRYDSFNNEIEFEDRNGDTRVMSYDEVYDLKRSGDLKAVSQVVSWEGINSNEEYTFETDGSTYTGEVVGFDDDSVTVVVDGDEKELRRSRVEQIRSE